MDNNSKGFTIIELIVVIAIISVLATIIVIKVTAYINKSKDASIKGNMASMITSGVVFFNTSGNYTGLCTDTTNNFLAAFNSAISKQKSGGVSHCLATATEWAASVQINNPVGGGSSNGFWCVDSTGTKKETLSAPGAVSVCP